MHRTVGVVVAVLVVLSGCSLVAQNSPSEDTPSDGAAPVASDTESTGDVAPDATTRRPGETAAPTATAVPTNTGSPTPTPEPPKHPWAGETVTVEVVDRMPGPREFVPLVRDAADEWNGTTVTGGDVRFRVVRNATTADVRLAIRPRIRTCRGRTADASFDHCVPRVTPSSTSESITAGSLAGGYTNETFLQVAAGGFARLVDREPARSLRYPPDSYSYADPWPGSHPVVVNVSNAANESRNFTRLVRRAVTWWEDRPDSQKDYATEFVVRPDARNADLHVSLVTNVSTCGIDDSGEIVGCASLLDTDSVADDPTVRIEAGYTDDSTLRILRHEFGHVHGRSHGESPMPLMNESTDVVVWPVRNATDRSLPWRDGNLSVYLDARGDVSGSLAWEDVGPALEYFEDGAGGWLTESVTFERTDDRSRADVSITVSDGNECGFEYGGICDIYTNGTNLDDDDSFEYYTHANMTITVTERDERAWFVGYGLGHALGATNRSTLPPPLRDVDGADERWWD